MFLDKLFLMIVVSLFVQAPQKAPNILDNEVFLLGDYEYFWLGACLWSCAISAHINIYLKCCFFLFNTQHETLLSANILFKAQTAEDSQDANV